MTHPAIEKGSGSTNYYIAYQNTHGSAGKYSYTLKETGVLIIMAHDPHEASLLLQESISRLSEKHDHLKRTVTELSQSDHGEKAFHENKLTQVVHDVDSDIKTVQFSSRQMLTQIEHLNALIRTMQCITSTLDFDATIAEIIDTAIELTHAERAYLVLLEAGSNEVGNHDYQVRAARNWIHENLSEADLEMSRSVINEAVSTAEPVLIVNATSDERFQDKKSIMLHQLSSVLCLPLVLRGQVIGAFYLDNKSTPGVFDRFSIPILSTFANQAAIAIDNARQFSSVKEDLAEARQQVQQLEIVVNRHNLAQQVEEVTNTEYFQDLAKKAKRIRELRDADTHGSP